MLTLKEGFGLHMQPYNNKVRLVVMRNNEEYVCRMETLRKLKEFVQLKRGQAFKGRLQLYKDAGFISVVVKGEVAGITDEGSFSNYLDALQW